MRFADFWAGLNRLVCPPACWLCDAPLSDDRDGFCLACELALSDDPYPACSGCAAILGPHVNDCPHCRDEGFPFEAAYRLTIYQDIAQQAVLAMKFAHYQGLAMHLGRLWGRARPQLAQCGAGVVTAVPLHWRRRWQRGYNQAAALGQALARELRLPFETHLVRRVRPTLTQVSLSATQRRENLRQAFRPYRLANLRGQHVLLVDDVMTTGTTCRETTNALLAGGAKAVTLAVLTRARSATIVPAE